MDSSILAWTDMKRSFLKRISNENTKRLYSRSLTIYRQFLQKYDKDLHPVTGDYRSLRTAIEDYSFSATTKVKASTVEVRVAAISSFYKWLIGEDFIHIKNPAKGIKIWNDDPPRVPMFPDAELADKLEGCLHQDAEGGQLTRRRDWLMFRFLSEGGFRASELCNIKLRDVDVLSGKVAITRAKGNKTRITAVLLETVQALEEFASEYSLQPEDYIFMAGYQYTWDEERKRHWRTGIKPISVDALKKMLREGATRHGFSEKEVKRLQSPHGFRHLWAVRQVEAGTNHVYIMLMGGWTNMNMLQYYINHASFEVQAVARQ